MIHIGGSKNDQQTIVQSDIYGTDAAQDPNECLEIMFAPSFSSSSSSSSDCPHKFEFDPYHDKPISTHTTASRSVVHQNGLWHNSVHIWIISPSAAIPSSSYGVGEEASNLSSSSPAEILLQKRSSTKDTFPNRYDISCAGHVSSCCMTHRNNQNTNINHFYYYGHEDYSLLDTLRAELSEELGWIDGIHVDVALELSQPAFIIPAQQSHLGGCNAFEHVYFLIRCRDCLDDAEDEDDNIGNTTAKQRIQHNTNHDHTLTVPRSVGEFSLGSAEVSEVLWRPVHEVLDALRSGDDSYALRTREYVDAMEKELDKLLFGGVSS